MRELRSLGKSLAGIAGVILFSAGTQAGPLEELRAVAQLPAIDLAQLKSGQIVTQRAAEGDFSRGISIQSCYFVAAPVAAVGKALLHWNPAQHRGSDVRLYREYSLSAPRGAFEGVRLNSNIANDRWLLERTYEIADGGAAGDLHLTAPEVELVRKEVPKKGAAAAQAREARANDAWGAILRRRSESLAQGGMAAVAPYGNDRSISPGSEFRGLLSLDSRAAKHFRPIVTARPFAAKGSAAAEVVGYWETTQVRSHTALQLGVFAAHETADSWQLADCIYYPSDTYFMALNLFQLWPVEGGTLVWQVGFVSVPFRGYLGGVDRYVARKQLKQETIETIKAFQAALARQR